MIDDNARFVATRFFSSPLSLLATSIGMVADETRDRGYRNWEIVGARIKEGNGAIRSMFAMRSIGSR